MIHVITRFTRPPVTSPIPHKKNPPTTPRATPGGPPTAPSIAPAAMLPAAPTTFPAFSWPAQSQYNYSLITFYLRPD